MRHLYSSAESVNVSKSELRAFEEVSQLKAELRTLNRRLDTAKSKKAELADVLREAVKECLLEYETPKLSPPPKDTRQQTAEVAVCVLSDWQLGKKTPTYDSDVCAERVRRYVRKVRRLVARHRAQCPVRELRIYLLGDLVEGELIFPGQAHLIDSSLYRQLTEGAAILSNAVLELAQEGSVRVRGVIGNHGAIGGRSRREMHPESNADALLYEFARFMARGQERVDWKPAVNPGERLWFSVDNVGSKRFMLFHGDQIRGHAGLPWYGYSRKVMGWQQLGIDGGRRFDYALSGHWHTPTRMYFSGTTVWVNGSTESHNSYAQEQLAASGTPCQWLLFCHPERGVTAEYLVHLEED